ncbi:MAG TPA: DUF2188 domain-containing protein [Ignavibacteriaceae bacterium]|nr:DUF2188 domain-containing protein [Ignavibacteriaceae bacterium]
MKKIFISPYKGVWCIRYEGEMDVLSLCETTEQAIVAARAYASRDNNEIYIVRADGSVESKIEN